MFVLGAPSHLYFWGTQIICGWQLLVFIILEITLKWHLLFCVTLIRANVVNVNERHVCENNCILKKVSSYREICNIVL